MIKGMTQIPANSVKQRKKVEEHREKEDVCEHSKKEDGQNLDNQIYFLKPFIGI